MMEQVQGHYSYSKGEAKFLPGLKLDHARPFSFLNDLVIFLVSCSLGITNYEMILKPNATSTCEIIPNIDIFI